MKKLLINEAYKIKFIKMILIGIGVFILLNILYYSTMENSNSINWRDKAQEERATAVYYLDMQTGENGDNNSESIEIYNNIISKIDYSIQNDIPYGVFTVWDCMINIDGMDTFVFLIIIIFSAKVICKEDENKTWKNILTTSVKQNKILISKVLFAIFQTFTLILLFIIISFLFGAFFCGFGTTNTIINFISGNFISQNIIIEVLEIEILLTIKALFYTMFTMLLSSLFGKNVISFTFPIVLLLFGTLIFDQVQNFSINKYLPFKYIFTNSSVEFIGNNFSITFLVLLGYTTLCTIFTVLLFKRKDF